MSINTITNSGSRDCCSYFNNGTTCLRINNFPPIKLLKKSDELPPLSINFNTKYQSLRIVPISGSLRPQASSSSSSSSSSPSPSSSSPWKKWLWGVLLTVILPAAGHKGGLLIGLKGKIDQALETVEHVTEMVEEMAEEAEKIVEEVEEKLPGDSKIKKALDSFENLAKVAVKEAKRAEDIIHKVKDVEEEIEGVLMKGGKNQDDDKKV
ncbi:uncharacterized protein LOC125202072 isoform X2 [Salvia hispanica]|uniref:uncharacterized protein LOC125202072 isoform X2 n=1 Tax=Salvia hispanica TaxID=49212 RepID=UPI00200940FF|nr:uncharacterized protein LOC125202072 isoform X2 [Salvia hispanica]